MQIDETKGIHTERNQPPKEPRPHAREVILRWNLSFCTLEEGPGWLTLDWNVNRVKPRNTPNVINLFRDSGDAMSVGRRLSWIGGTHRA